MAKRKKKTPKRKSKRKITRAKRNPIRTKGYNATTVDAAIASSNRAGRHIGSKERKLIHSLLQGRSAKTTVTVKKNPISHKYVIRGNFSGKRYAGKKWFLGVMGGFTAYRKFAEEYSTEQAAKFAMEKSRAKWRSGYPDLRSVWIEKVTSVARG